MKYHLLVADDEYGIREFLYELFKNDFEVILTEDGEQAVRKLDEEVIDIALLDMRMPGKTGLEVMEYVHTNELNTICIFITADRDIGHAVDAMKNGAYDYVTKPVDYQKLKLIVRNAIEKRALEDKLNILEREFTPNYQFPNIIGESKAMKQVFARLENVLNNNSTVLIYGESGTGKEVIARAIHYNGVRKDMPFIPMDCASIPHSLIETELFGYEKGAFTGATKTTRGKFELADGGTLFLDEISNIDMEAQAKLLRVIQEREFIRIGGEKKISVDVRIISASNKNLKELISRNEFREDLYYRLNVIPINLPPLRERTEDIPLLVKHFLDRYCDHYQKNVSINNNVMKILLNYRWPGNIRELENLLNRLVLIADSDTIRTTDLPEEIVAQKPQYSDSDNVFNRDISLDALERMYISKLLNRHENNISTVSKILGITRKTLYAKMEKYDLARKG